MDPGRPYSILCRYRCHPGATVEQRWGANSVVVPAVPKGQNAIMDLMHEYTHIDWPQGILIVDAIYMILTSLITMLLASVDPSAAWVTLIITLYTTMYVLYTRPS